MKYGISSLSTILEVAFWIGVAHVVSGVCILFEPRAILVSAFAGLKWVTAMYAPGDHLAGLMLIVIGTMAMFAGTKLTPIRTHTRLRLITPQAVLLVFTLASIGATIVEGKYPDGYIPQGGHVFILADQAIAGLISLFHVSGVLNAPVKTVEMEALQWG